MNDLWQQPPRADDREHPLRLGYGVPIPEWVRAFERRFDMTMITNYGASEVLTAAFETTPAEPGGLRVGRVRQGITMEIHDDDDLPVPAGDVGEIVVRRWPGEVMDGYYCEPDRTLAVFPEPVAPHR